MRLLAAESAAVHRMHGFLLETLFRLGCGTACKGRLKSDREMVYVSQHNDDMPPQHASL